MPWHRTGFDQHNIYTPVPVYIARETDTQKMKEGKKKKKKTLKGMEGPIMVHKQKI